MAAAYKTHRLASREAVDDCAAEPIRIPGSIQPHGLMMVLDGPSYALRQASANAAGILNRPLAAALGQPLDAILAGDAPDLLEDLRTGVPMEGTGQLRIVRLADRVFEATAHRANGAVVVELEETNAAEIRSLDALYPEIRAFVTDLQRLGSLDEIGMLAAAQVRRMTGFDRVLIYRFEENWDGTVVAEDRNNTLPSYLDLRFPASDIPAQARDLYATNRLRLIADAHYHPVPLVPVEDPATGGPTDLSQAALRSVSPVHLEYMRNMGTAASMSVSIVEEGRLWGLISCHNAAPKRVPSHVRTACDFLGQILAMQLSSTRRGDDAAQRIAAQTIEGRLLAYMAGAERFIDGLIRHPDDLLALTGAAGAAVVFDGMIVPLGQTPDEAGIERIVDWLWKNRSHDEVVATHSLPQDMPGAQDLAPQASGVLAISISQLHPSYIVWFRPEIVRTVRWAGEPRKAVRVDRPVPRLEPRASFEAWKETVRLTAEPWPSASVATAGSLRNAIVGIVMRKAEELAQLSEDLSRSNKELEAFSYSISHDLRAPFRHIIGYSELLSEHAADRLDERSRRYLATIIEAANSAGKLVDDLLGFARVGRTTLALTRVDMNRFVDEARRMLALDVEGRSIEWQVEKLPAVMADSALMRQVFQNLISNAVKYTRKREHARIRIASHEEGKEIVFVVEDNGAGFDMAYVEKLFGVFQRLHRTEDFEGTGIGLANVRRILERHGGRAWAEGRPNEGASFYFALPRPSERP